MAKVMRKKKKKSKEGQTADSMDKSIRKVKRKRAFKMDEDVRESANKVVRRRVKSPRPQSIQQRDARRALEQTPEDKALVKADISMKDAPDFTPAEADEQRRKKATVRRRRAKRKVQRKKK